MTERYIEFLVDPTGKSPRNLKDSIRRVLNASAGFRQSWLNGEQTEAFQTSQEAFEHLDYIQNELLRQRDVHKSNTASWPTSLFCSALTAPVGQLLNSVTPADRSWFLSLPQGQGAMPAGSTLTLLTLDKALNKLKHRDTIAFNFTLPSGGGHTLYLFTKAGMGQPDTLSEIDVAVFCDTCKSAAAHI
jgi:hypothetical protein